MGAERANNEEQLKKQVDLLFEVGMLRHTPRTGYQFLGSGSENVAEHSHRSAVIAYLLARLAGADSGKAVLMALFHDLPEARTGDFNYVNKIYNKCAPARALSDALSGTGLEDELIALWDELEAGQTLEARLAGDADQLDLILNLKREQDLGNPYAAKWAEAAQARLKTAPALDLAAMISKTDHTDWWFAGQPAKVWINGPEE